MQNKLLLIIIIILLASNKEISCRSIMTDCDRCSPAQKLCNLGNQPWLYNNNKLNSEYQGMCCDIKGPQSKLCKNYENGGVIGNKCSPLSSYLMADRIYQYCPKPQNSSIDICGEQQIQINGTQSQSFVFKQNNFGQGMQKACFYEISTDRQQLNLNQNSAIQIDFKQISNLNIQIYNDFINEKPFTQFLDRLDNYNQINNIQIADTYTQTSFKLKVRKRTIMIITPQSSPGLSVLQMQYQCKHCQQTYYSMYVGWAPLLWIILFIVLSLSMWKVFLFYQMRSQQYTAGIQYKIPIKLVDKQRGIKKRYILKHNPHLTNLNTLTQNKYNALVLNESQFNQRYSIAYSNSQKRMSRATFNLAGLQAAVNPTMETTFSRFTNGSLIKETQEDDSAGVRQQDHTLYGTSVTEAANNKNENIAINKTPSQDTRNKYDETEPIDKMSNLLSAQQQAMNYSDNISNEQGSFAKKPSADESQNQDLNYFGKKKKESKKQKYARQKKERELKGETSQRNNQSLTERRQLEENNANQVRNMTQQNSLEMDKVVKNDNYVDEIETEFQQLTDVKYKN